MKITVNDLIKSLETIKDKTKKIYVSSDEEFNTIFNEFRISTYDKDSYVIFGLSGTELEE
jgi:hypothetical protein